MYLFITGMLLVGALLRNVPAPTNNIPVINKYIKGKENVKACHSDLHSKGTHT
jgi:hypothetical protein